MGDPTSCQHFHINVCRPCSCPGLRGVPDDGSAPLHHHVKSAACSQVWCARPVLIACCLSVCRLPAAAGVRLRQPVLRRVAVYPERWLPGPGGAEQQLHRRRLGGGPRRSSENAEPEAIQRVVRPCLHQVRHLTLCRCSAVYCCACSCMQRRALPCQQLPDLPSSHLLT